MLNDPVSIDELHAILCGYVPPTVSNFLLHDIGRWMMKRADTQRCRASTTDDSMEARDHATLSAGFNFLAEEILDYRRDKPPS